MYSRVRCGWCVSRRAFRNSPSRYYTTSLPTLEEAPTPEYLAATLLPSLPPNQKNGTDRKLLILDLNGVLLMRSPLERGKGERIVWPRPYMQTFRQYLFHPATQEWLDTMVWSSAKPFNVNKMVDATFGDKKTHLMKIWARDRMGLDATAYDRKARTVKDMRTVWKELARNGYPYHSSYTTLLMDDSHDKARLQPYNHIVVPEYEKDLRAHDLSVLKVLQPKPNAMLKRLRFDDTLLCAVGILEVVKKQANVANWIRQGGLRLEKAIGEAMDESNSWWMDEKVREHWRESGMAVLSDLKIELTPAVRV